MIVKKADWRQDKDEDGRSIPACGGAEHGGEPAPQTGNVSHVTEHHGCSS